MMKEIGGNLPICIFFPLKVGLVMQWDLLIASNDTIYTYFQYEKENLCNILPQKKTIKEPTKWKKKVVMVLARPYATCRHGLNMAWHGQSLAVSIFHIKIRH